MTGWDANQEFVSARAECQLVKDGVRSWEAVRRQPGAAERPPPEQLCAADARRRRRTKAGPADGGDQGGFLRCFCPVPSPGHPGEPLRGDGGVKPRARTCMSVGLIPLPQVLFHCGKWKAASVCARARATGSD